VRTSLARGAAEPHAALAALAAKMATAPSVVSLLITGPCSLRQARAPRTAYCNDCCEGACNGAAVAVASAARAGSASTKRFTSLLAR